jgi:hypothetical protein
MRTRLCRLPKTAKAQLSGASGKLIEIFRAADNLRDNDVTLRDSPHDYSRPGPEP